MKDLRLKVWSTLPFMPPAPYLARLRPIQYQLAASDLREKVKRLETRSLRRHSERRQAALFAQGMSVALNCPSLEIAMVEDQDYDCVVRHIEKGEEHYTPVQLKRFVSESANRERKLEEEVAKLSKYADSKDLVVAFFLSRAGRLNFSHLVIPSLPIGGLWFYGSLSVDQSRWFLFGDALCNPALVEFEHPV